MKYKKIKRTVSLVVFFVMMLMVFTACSKEKQDEKQEVSTNIEDTEISEQKEDIEINTEEDTSEEEEESQEAVLDEANAVAMKTTADVNFRKEPNTSCEVIKVLAKGTEVTQYEVENGWALVKYGEEIGYVNTDFLADPSKVQEETKQTTTSSNKVEVIPGQHRNANSAVVVIDPGHQRSGDSTKELNGPGSSEMKARVTSGATGVSTGVAEYILNLDIGLQLKTELENRGYTVYMTRSTHDVNISNMERAQYASSVGADIAVRIHANGAASSVKGAETLCPSSANQYVSHLASASYSLSKCVIDEYCAATGFINRGVKYSDTMTGINWSEVPVTIIELGFMSNPEEDQLMQDPTMQNNMVQGIANGIDAYFGF